MKIPKSRLARSKSIKEGDWVVWDWSGEARKGGSALLVGPAKVVRVVRNQLELHGPTLTGAGCWVETVPRCECLIATKAELRC